MIRNEIPIADRSTSRIINQRALLDKIYRNDGISKAVLAQELGLSKPAVSNNVADLISMGLVEEKGEGEASKNGGRKPILLYFNGTHRYISALDLSLQKPVCAIGDLKHHILRLRKVDIDRESSAEEKLRCVERTFDELLNDLSIPTQKLGLMIVSHPGILGKDNEVLHVEARHKSWTNIGLVDYLKERYEIPILLENNVRLAAIGEMQLGNDQPLKDFIYVDCGVGLGMCAIVKAQPYEGKNRVSDGIGSFLFDNGQRAEDAIAMEGLLSRVADIHFKANQLNDSGSSKCQISDDVLYRSNEKMFHYTFAQVVDLSKSGDSLVNRVLLEVGRELGRVIYNCSILLDIPTVIFGGDYLKLGPALFEGINEMISKDLPYRPEVIKSSLHEAAGVLGGFVFGQEKFLKMILT